MKPFVSIIIPTFNRGHLLGETLESVLAQTYSNWECIIVDDGSADATDELMEFYIAKDFRIQYYHRPEERPKGANTCRNYGLTQSSGRNIIWFDSDDLMTPDHIQEKVGAIENSGSDFIVAKTANFQGKELFPSYKYEIKDYGIKASDFILMKIHWYTYDVLMKRKVAEKILWNERMQSWQDYNYFCKMLIETVNGSYLNKVLTHRRLHSDSIQKSLTANKAHFLGQMLDNRLLTFQDLEKSIDGFTKRELIYDMMNISFKLTGLQHFHFRNISQVVRIILRNRNFKSVLLFLSSLITAFISEKGEYLLEKSKERSRLLQ